MRKIGSLIKGLGKGVIVAATLAGVLYKASPKLGYKTHKVQEELVDTLGKRNILVDEETNDIINLMSGTITQDRLYALLSKYGQQSDMPSLDSLGGKDDALKNAILHMQTKYGNPKINFSGDFSNYEIGQSENHRARFTPSSNTMHLLKLDSVVLDLKKASHFNDNRQMVHMDRIRLYSRQAELLDSWIAELAHAKQLDERGIIKFTVDSDIDDMSIKKTKEELYHIKGTIEYQAHKEYESNLKKEFVDTYFKYASKSNEQTYITGIKLYNWLPTEVNTSTNTDLMILQFLESGAHLNKPTIDYLIGKQYFRLLQQHYDYLWGMKREEYEIINEQKITMPQILEKIKSHYLAAYNSGFDEAGHELCRIMYNYAWKNYGGLDFVINFGKKVLEESKLKSSSSTLGDLCRKIGSAYYMKNDDVNGKMYYRIGDEYGRGYEGDF